MTSENSWEELTRLIDDKTKERDEIGAKLRELGQDDCNGDHADASFVYTQKSLYCEQFVRLGRVIEVAERILRQLNERGIPSCMDCGMDLNVWELIAHLWRNSIPEHYGCRFGVRRHRR